MIKQKDLILYSGLIILGLAAPYLFSAFKVMKKEKCISKGVTIGGDNADAYMPQFINFFKQNLL